MRSHLAFLVLGLSLSTASACSDDTKPNPQPDGALPDVFQRDVVSVDGAPSDGLVPDAVGDDLHEVDLISGDLAPDLPGVDLTPDLPGVDLTPDLPGAMGPGRCATAPVLTLVNGTVMVEDDISRYSNEFDTGCRTSTSSTTTMKGPQAYFQFSGVKDQWYRFVLKPSSTAASLYMYAFTNTACTEAAIETDCTSDGATGASLRTYADGDDPRVLYFKAPANGSVYVAVDSTKTPKDGHFELIISEIATPTNAKCASAKQLIFFNGKAVVDGDTHHKMTPDEFPGAHCSSYTRLDGPQVYYKFDAVVGKSYRIKVTNNAGYYLYAYVFGAACTESAISADCSSPTSGAYTSSSFDAPHSRELAFSPTVSGTYHIAIDGTMDYYNGYFTLEVEEFTPPPNAKCSSAEPITFVQGKSKMTGSTLGMVNEFGTSIDCTGSKSFDGSQAYFRLTAVANKAYEFTLYSDFESYLYLFKASSCGQTSSMNADCGSEGVDGDLFGYVKPSSSKTFVFRPTTPGDYILAVDANYVTSYGGYELSVKEFDAPKNDIACSATPLTLTNGRVEVSASSYAARNEFGTSSATGIACGSYLAFDGGQVYYEFQVDSSSVYVLTLSPSFSNAYMYVFQKGSCSSRSSVDADCGSKGVTGAYVGSIYTGSTGSINFNPSNSGSYIVAVDTSNTPGGGGFSLMIEEFAKPANETCATASPLTLVNGSVEVSSTTAFAPDEYSGLTCKTGTTMSSSLDGPQLYWSMNFDATKLYALSVTTGFLSGYLYLFDGSKACSEANIAADCQSGGASGLGKGMISETTRMAYFKPPSSGPYKIAVDSYADGGKVTLKVDEFSPASNQTCSTAKTLSFVNNKVVVDGFTYGASDEFSGSITCGSSSTFSGGQVYYKVPMEANRDYFVSISTDVPSGVYLFRSSSACTFGSIEADCSSGGSSGNVAVITSSGGGSTGFRFRAKVTDSYYVVVDTMSTTEAGRYTLTINEVVPPSGPRLVIAEINTGTDDYVVLRNAGTADVSLNNVEFIMTDGTISSPDNHITLPNQILKAGSSVYLVENSNPNAGDIYIGSGIYYTYSSSFVALLCQGKCDAGNASNVIDAARFGTKTSSQLPSGVSFVGLPVSGLTSANQNTSSFTRVGFAGKNPVFAALDWSIQAATR